MYEDLVDVFDDLEVVSDAMAARLGSRRPYTPPGAVGASAALLANCFSWLMAVAIAAASP